MPAAPLTPEERLARVHPALPIGLINNGLDALTDLSPAGLDPTVALELARELLVAADRVKALALRSVADMDRRDLYALDNAPSTGTWVAEQPASMPRSEVTLARLGRWAAPGVERAGRRTAAQRAGEEVRTGGAQPRARAAPAP